MRKLLQRVRAVQGPDVREYSQGIDSTVRATETGWLMFIDVTTVIEL